MEQISPLPNYLTVRQFSQKHPAFSEGGLRWGIFNEKINGMSVCIHRIGRKVLIDEGEFFLWVSSLNPPVPQKKVGQR